MSSLSPASYATVNATQIIIEQVDGQLGDGSIFVSGLVDAATLDSDSIVSRKIDVSGLGASDGQLTATNITAKAYSSGSNSVGGLIKGSTTDIRGEAKSASANITGEMHSKSAKIDGNLVAQSINCDSSLGSISSTSIYGAKLSAKTFVVGEDTSSLAPLAGVSIGKTPLANKYTANTHTFGPAFGSGATTINFAGNEASIGVITDKINIGGAVIGKNGFGSRDGISNPVGANRFNIGWGTVSPDPDRRLNRAHLWIDATDQGEIWTDNLLPRQSTLADVLSGGSLNLATATLSGAMTSGSVISNGTLKSQSSTTGTSDVTGTLTAAKVVATELQAGTITSTSGPISIGNDQSYVKIGGSSVGKGGFGCRAGTVDMASPFHSYNIAYDDSALIHRASLWIDALPQGNIWTDNCPPTIGAVAGILRGSNLIEVRSITITELVTARSADLSGGVTCTTLSVGAITGVSGTGLLRSVNVNVDAKLTSLDITANGLLKAATITSPNVTVGTKLTSPEIAVTTKLTSPQVIIGDSATNLGTLTVNGTMSINNLTITGTLTAPSVSVPTQNLSLDGLSAKTVTATTITASTSLSSPSINTTKIGSVDQRVQVGSSLIGRGYGCKSGYTAALDGNCQMFNIQWHPAPILKAELFIGDLSLGFIWTDNCRPPQSGLPT